jgi:hypothetical protein
MLQAAGGRRPEGLSCTGMAMGDNGICMHDTLAMTGGTARRGA